MSAMLAIAIAIGIAHSQAPPAVSAGPSAGQPPDPDRPVFTTSQVPVETVPAGSAASAEYYTKIAERSSSVRASPPPPAHHQTHGFFGSLLPD